MSNAASADDVADLAVGSFSDDPPWQVDVDRLDWLAPAAVLRQRIRASVPALVAPHRVPPGLRVLTVVWHLGVGIGLWWLRERGTASSRAGISRRLRVACERLGPAYIKLGQILSAGDGFFPVELVAEFKKCRDQVPPEKWSDIETIIEADLGAPLDSLFAEIDHEPIAAASIAQVHAARLTTGESVVVKVQRPTVAKLVHQDLRVMAWLAPYLVGRIPVTALANPPALVRVFAETITEELDFRVEAANMVDIAVSLRELGQREFVVPRPHPALVTERVLVMERLSGFAFDDVTGMHHAGMDTPAIVRAGMIGFMEGAMIKGLFHGDLHGGNLLVLPDGRTALLDYGIVGRLDDSARLAFLRLLVSGTTSDIRGQMFALRDLGALPPDAEVDSLIVELGLDRPPADPTKMSSEELVAELQRMVKTLLGSGARMPKELMLFVKNMVFLDGAIATLAPDLDLFAEITHVATYFATTHGERIAGELGLGAGGYEIDVTAMKASFGVDLDETDRLTYRELRERRAMIHQRLGEHRNQSSKPPTAQRIWHRAVRLVTGVWDRARSPGGDRARGHPR